MVRREQVSELVGLVDRLEELMERSTLAELEVEAGGTTLILRSAAAVAPVPLVTTSAIASGATPEAGPASAPEPEMPGAHHVLAPLTGVYYASPTPDAEPYVREGGPVNVGQVIGLIEAMKLFNEIKSDVTGTVRRQVAADGDLVKAKQVLIEVDPS